MQNIAEAKELFSKAEELERKGLASEAAQLFRKAYKICPTLDEFERQMEENVPVPLSMQFQRLPDPETSGFRTFDYQKFSEEEAIKFLDDQGYLVVDNVLTPDEVKQAIKHFERFMALRHNDVTDARKIRPYGDMQNGIVGKGCAGHSAMNWFVRSRASVKRVFRLANKLKDGDKMITSFDGFNWLRNPETNPSWQGSTKPWFHFDATSWTDGRYIQGFVNLVDTTHEMDAGLILLPRSHETCFKRLVQEDGEVGGITFIDGEERAIINNELNVTERSFRVPMKAGSLVLWRSSVMHCNTACQSRAPATAAAAADDSSTAAVSSSTTTTTTASSSSSSSSSSCSAASTYNPEQLVRRLVVYVCMMPDPQSAEITKQRLAQFHRGNSTSHHPDLGNACGDVACQGDAESGAIIISEDKLPEGALELL